MAEDERDLLDTVLKGAGITAIGIFASKFLSFLFRTTIARLLGPDSYGILAVGITAAGMASTISFLALFQAIRNYVPKYEERNDQAGIKGIVITSFYLTMPLAILSTLILFFGAEWIAATVFKNPNVASIIKVMSFTPIFSIIGSICLSTTRGMKIQKYHTFTRKMFQPTVQLIAAAILILAGFGIIGAGIGWVLGALASAVLGLYFMEFKSGPILRSDVKARFQGRKLLNYSLPLLMTGIIGSILTWTDTIVIGYFQSEAQLGLYNAALPAAILLMLPYQALRSLLLPSMSSAVERDEGDLSEMLKTVTRWTVSISFPIFCLMILFPEELLKLLFGSQYLNAATALGVLAFGKIFSASVGHLDTVIKAINRTDILFKNSLINVVVNIGLTVYLVPKFGIVGAAIGTTVSIILAQLLLLAEVYYFQGTHPFSSVLYKPVAASLVSLMIVYGILRLFFTSYPWWIMFPAGAVYGLIYLGIYYFLGIEEEDMEIVKNMLRDIWSRLFNLLPK